MDAASCEHPLTGSGLVISGAPAVECAVTGVTGGRVVVEDTKERTRRKKTNPTTGVIEVTKTRTRTRIVTLFLLVWVALLTSAAGRVAPAVAAPAFRLDALMNTTAAPGQDVSLLGQVTNVGTQAASGPASILITLPRGITGVSMSVGGGFSCTDVDGSSPVLNASIIRCDTSGLGISRHGFSLINGRVHIDPAATGTLTTVMSLSGGGSASDATTVVPVRATATLPAFGIAAFDAQVSEASGDPYTQAAGHPYAASASIDFNTSTNPRLIAGDLYPVEAAKDIFVDLPPGFVGSPATVEQCTAEQLGNSELIRPRPFCPGSSQVGTALIRFNGIGFPNVVGPVPVYNMVPPPDAPARFGMNVLGTVITLNASLRSAGDYGLTVTAANIPEALQIAGTTVTFWGVPSDLSHDNDRACIGDYSPFDVVNPGASCRSSAPRTAFLRNPTSCPPPGQGLPTTLRADSWQHPGVFQESTFFSHLTPAYPFPREAWGDEIGTTNCAGVPFNPTLDAHPSAPDPEAGKPSGLTVDLTIPQTDDPDVPGQSDLKKAVVTLPLGLRVLPASATGLQGCSSAQIALRSDTDPTCPNGSKIGSLTIDTPLIDDQLTGGIYLATPFDNPFNTLIAVYIAARGPGINVKLAGRVDRTDDGQITATFDDNPQLPFGRLHLEFNGGSRAPLALPKACGTYTTHSVLTGWSGAVVTSDSSFTLTHNGKGTCTSTFAPGFDAGTSNPTAGESSPFHLSLTRDDEDAELKALTVSMPNGLTGKIANVTKCTEAAAQAGACSEASRVGSVTVGAGAGPTPFYISNGRAYLTGPYKGAPFGLDIVVPAVAGPFDLGNVNVRSAIFVDKHTAELRVVSDPLPTILQGIPLDVRDVRVAIDRRDFIVNPTSCAPKTIGGTINAIDGRTANVSSRFQVGDCASLGFRPRMVLRVGGSGHTARNKTTPLTTTIRMPKGQANLRFVQVTLPQAINARLTVINDACTRREFEASLVNCRHAQAGTAIASTPLLRDPLKGAVYFVKNGHPLPDLFIALRGEVEFDLIGRITIPGSKRLRTTFDSIPDVPVRSFTLRLFGDAKNGSIGAATNLCSRRGRNAKVELDYIGQNGKVDQVAQRMSIGGCDGKAKKSGTGAGRR